ncbi:VirK/YbjX family protein [Paucibacter sp. Y2R2-4]|uniref:VirK/YbjX family protein n=1 Tax=Paucibacter sp. Y2R2-4 TaxID=2893553 RepID=UPI0021E38C81|nr:VirK/YbjX family protein [Paucibacter sp. Y2R2-4]MCV2351401.1 VirK/YbjX family protein [Paucibacter sp. Y2R2-4]
MTQRPLKIASRISSLGERIGFKDKAKIYAGALLHPDSTRRWLAFVDQHPMLGGALSVHPKLLTKIYRPYFSTQLGCASRVDLLIEHYSFLIAHGWSDLLAASAVQNQTLCEFEGKSGERFQLELSAVHEGHREGELCLRLMLGTEMVFNASFLFLQRQGRPCVAIGRLQGGNTDGARDLVKKATRDFYGARPSAVLVQAVRQIGLLMGCEKLLLISNRERIALNPWRRRKITSDYDTMWTELGATQCDSRQYELICAEVPAPDLAEVASKKRAEVKRKFALFDEMYAGLAARLDGLQPAAEAASSST